MMNAALAAELSRLASIYGVDALRTEVETVRLPDFSRAMETELHKLVASYRHPVWTNRRTGNPASSVHAAFDALGFSTSAVHLRASNRSHRSLN